MTESGIIVAGNMIVDILYPITNYPDPGQLGVILDPIERSTGGCLCNVAVDLAKLDPALDVTAIGRIGDDAQGDFVLQKLNESPNINTSRIIREGKTSFTAVMADEQTKQRTFFQYPGANSSLCEADFDLTGLNPKMLHIGYIMLLGNLDEPDEAFGTKMARLLHNMQQRGILTSVDLVSVASDKFSQIVPPSLKYSDYCTINEYEAQLTTGIMLRSEDDKLIEQNMRPALERLFQMGVSRWAVIHSVEGCFGMNEKGEYHSLKSLDLPKGYIKGSVGAGDAFCSGVIYSAYMDMPLADALKLGIASAACSLSRYSATDGVKTAPAALSFYDELAKL